VERQIGQAEELLLQLRGHAKHSTLKMHAMMEQFLEIDQGSNYIWRRG